MRYLLILLAAILTRGDCCQENTVYTSVSQILNEIEEAAWQVERTPPCKFILEIPQKNKYSMTSADEIFENEAVSKYFKVEDKQAFNDQIKQYQDFSYKNESITGKSVISMIDLDEIDESHGNFWDFYEKKYGKTGFYNISFPLFSKDGTTLLINIEKFTFRQGSHGGIHVYKKAGGKWKSYKVLYSWAGQY